MNKKLTDSEVIKIIVQWTRDLALHEGRCEVLQKMYDVATSCEEEGEEWVLTADEVEKYAKEEFNISL